MVRTRRRASWLCLLIGGLLVASWLSGPLRPLWDELDALVFNLTNPARPTGMASGR